jgi:hypothetical protein
MELANKSNARREREMDGLNKRRNYYISYIYISSYYSGQC